MCEGKVCKCTLKDVTSKQREENYGDEEDNWTEDGAHGAQNRPQDGAYGTQNWPQDGTHGAQNCPQDGTNDP